MGGSSRRCFADITPWDCFAVASEQGLVLGQRCVDGKSNEITAMPELLDQLALADGIVTLDAMGCQTAIAEKILAHAAVVEHFDQHCFRRGASRRADCDAFDDKHGRLACRRAFASTEAAALDALGGWPGLRTVLAVESIRSVNSAPKVESESRYLLSSCPDSPAALGQAIRSRWAVANALHWVREVTFREDDSRVRDRTAARNLALLRKIALNIVGRDKTTKASVRARRKRAAWNDAYMLKLLLGWPQNFLQDQHKISCVAPDPSAPSWTGPSSRWRKIQGAGHFRANL